MSVMDVAKKEDKKSKKASNIRKTTGRMLELGVQQAVVTTLVPGAAAGVGGVMSGMMPVMTVKAIADDMTEGGCVPTGKDTIVGLSERMAAKYTTGVGHVRLGATCLGCGRKFKHGEAITVKKLGGQANPSIATCPDCGGSLKFRKRARRT